MNGFEFFFNCFPIVWNWRFVGVADTTFFLYICTTEFLLNFSLSVLSVLVLLRFSWAALYNNHNNQIGLPEALNFTAEFPALLCKEMTPSRSYARAPFFLFSFFLLRFYSTILTFHPLSSDYFLSITATALSTAPFTAEPASIPTYQVRLHHHQNFSR